MQNMEEYNAWLLNLPDSVKKQFLLMTTKEARAYAEKRVSDRLDGDPRISRLFDKRARQALAQKIYENVLEDQATVRKQIMTQRQDGTGGNTVIHQRSRGNY